MEKLVEFAIIGLNFIYFFHKLFPVKERIAFISRQSNDESVDYKLLYEGLKKENPQIEIVRLYKMIPESLVGRIMYLLHLVGPQMHAFATAKVVVLDGYSISASVLKHRKALKIIQMWHAMGSLKRFGYATLDKKEGSSGNTARAFHMHENYDFIFASSKNCMPALSKAYGNPVEKFVEMSLPRTDLLTDDTYMKQMKQVIMDKYPRLKEKRNILYTPTFRKNTDMKKEIGNFIKKIDYNKNNLIVKLHPLVLDKLDTKNALSCKEFSSLELLSVADCVVTDYSAFIFEAAIAGKPIVLYAYDLEEYKKSRGFLMDYETEMPGPICRNVDELISQISREKFDVEKVKSFAEKYVTHQRGCTQEIVKFIFALYNEQKL